MSTTETVETRVARGAAWLDDKKPGWERDIDLAQFDIEDSCRCILGHVFAVAAKENDCDNGFSWATACFDLVTFQNCIDHGFLWSRVDLGLGDVQCNAHRAEVEALDEAWISLIKERFSTGALSDINNES